MHNVIVALPNIGGALCSTPQRLADNGGKSSFGLGLSFGFMFMYEVRNWSQSVRTKYKKMLM